jgi:hypothetical protein
VPTIDDLTARLTGRFVTLEPLKADHVDGLYEAAKNDSELFRWMPVDLSRRWHEIRPEHLRAEIGEPRDSAYYSVIDDDWPELKPRLQQRVQQHLSRSA